MNGIKQFRKNKQGFLLVDAMIGVLVLVIGLAALAVLYMQGTDVSVKSDKMQAAVQVAGQEMERLKKADGRSLNEVKNIIGELNDKSRENIDDNNFVAMRGYTPDKMATEKDRFIITTSLNTTPVESKANISGYTREFVDYPVSVKVTWHDPQQTSYTVYGFVIVKN
jgi:hypothetical protein